VTFKRALAALGCLIAPIAMAACNADGKPSGDAAAGKPLFNACAGCHALADAGAVGLQQVDGIPVPNLDDAFRAARAAGIPESTYEGIIVEWIKAAEPPMPRDLLEGEDAANVAAYIASVAGRGAGQESAVVQGSPPIPDTPPEGPYAGEEPPQDPTATDTENAPTAPGQPAVTPPPVTEAPATEAPATEPTPSGTAPPSPPPAPDAETTSTEADAGSELTVDADPGGLLKFTQTELEASAGTVTFTLSNASPVPHNIAVKGGGVDSPPSETIQGGGTTTLSVDLPAGAYEFYCAVPGHEAAGMKGTLTVA
jgi:uncharacterized cupredoxin-like copper-binding protein/mono/diheme cytochrome c family protein